MKPTELRIGNWILDDKGNSAQVVEITDFDRVAVGTDRRVLDLQNAAPIPLTEEILLKAGFSGPEKTGKGSSEAIRYYIQTFRKDLSGLDIRGSCKYFYIVEEWCLFFFGQFKREPLRYVHQLQNLFFALTGQELEINL